MKIGLIIFFPAFIHYPVGKIVDSRVNLNFKLLLMFCQALSNSKFMFYLICVLSVLMAAGKGDRQLGEFIGELAAEATKCKDERH